MREHGDFVVGKSQQVVLFSARGPWNDETLKRGAKEMGGIIGSLDTTRAWGQISCLFGESLMPPSTFNEFAKHTAIRMTKGLSALAIVIKDSNIVNTIKHQLSQAYDEIGLPYAFFDDIDEAAQWLTAKRIDLELQQIRDFYSRNSFDNQTDH